MKVILRSALKITFLLSIFLGYSFLVYSQDSTSGWHGYYGGEGIDEAKSVRQLPDGGYVIVGSTNSKTGDVTKALGGYDAWVLRLDTFGQLRWQITLGGKKDDKANSVALGLDGNIAIAGYNTYSRKDKNGNHGKQDVFFAIIDSNGKVIRQNCFGGSEEEVANSIQATSDGGYILVGWTLSNDMQVAGNHGKQDVWIIKLSATGDLLWQRCYGGSKDDAATDIRETYSGDFVVCGYTYSNDGDITENKGESDYWVFLIDSAGNMLGQRTLGGSGTDKASAIVIDFDGGYTLAGFTNSSDGDITGHRGQEDYWIVKLNAEGTIEWQNAYGGSKEDIATALVQTSDGGYGVTGYTYSDDQDVSANYGKCDVWVLKLDSLGKIEWEASLGDKTWDVANSIEATSDYGFIVAGYAESRDKDFSTFNNIGDEGVSGDAGAAAATLIIWAGALVYDLLKSKSVSRDIWVAKF